MEARVSPALIFFQMFYEAKICLRKSSVVGLLVRDAAFSGYLPDSAVPRKVAQKGGGTLLMRQQTSLCI
jgi:hypothetical protein